MAINITPIFRAFYQGAIAAAATCDVYQTGTTTRVTLYSDAGLTIPITNPAIADSDGKFEFYTANDYALRYVIKTSSGSLIDDIDPIYPINNLTGLTASVSAINTAASYVGALTATTSELNILDGATLSTAELNILDGVTATTAEINLLDADSTTSVQKSGTQIIAKTEDSRTNSVATDIVRATTSGTPAANIGVGTLYQAESADENPSNFGQIEFAASDVTPGSEDTFFQILLRTAGAALAAAYRFVITSAFKYIFTGAPTADRTITLPDTDISQFIVQQVYTSTSAVATGTTQIPYDDTITQNTEGDQYLSLSITPKNSNNILLIEGILHFSTQNAARIGVALFQDSTANALAVSLDAEETANVAHEIPFQHRMIAGTTLSTTFKVRAGCNVAGTNTINGDSGNRKYGGVLYSWLRITELSA
jgi:hypothetical protein